MSAHVLSIVATGLLLMAGCAKSPPPNSMAQKLDVASQTTERYHVLAERPFDMVLAHEGYVIALEKITVGLANGSGRPRCAPTARQHPYDALIHIYDEAESAENPARAAHLHDRLDDRKLMVVTHVLAYEPGGVGARFLYNIYDVAESALQTGQEPQQPGHSGFVVDRATDAGTYSPLLGSDALVQPPGQTADSAFFQRGFDALCVTLREELRAKLLRAADAGQPYTHLILGSMGWDNDQLESVRRYSSTLSNVFEAARRDPGEPMRFRPLLVGITWPSVWGWASWFDFGQLAYKLAGYGNKADDADEVGYTIFNYLLNGLALDLKADLEERAPLRVVTFGHSFGGRVVSRALFSDHLLRDELRGSGPRPPIDLFVGLQPAFSINRFIQRCADAQGHHCGEEGSPYAGYADQRARIVLTTSVEDGANPLAWYLTRAEHVGGKRGLETARRYELKDGQIDGIFRILDYEDAGQQLANSETCARLRHGSDVIMVDASSFVFDHNDVLDLEAGELMWTAIRCFAPTLP
jgi:hypothetical protein